MQVAVSEDEDHRQSPTERQNDFAHTSRLAADILIWQDRACSPGISMPCMCAGLWHAKSRTSPQDAAGDGAESCLEYSKAAHIDTEQRGITLLKNI